jgi:altronate dehydratase small subunit
VSAIRLSPLDNVAILARMVPAGSTIVVDGCTLTVPASLGLGHKVALRPIAAGEKILKYGVPIGSATREIAAGEHVHVHNVQSDYLPTYTLDHGRLFPGNRR